MIPLEVYKRMMSPESFAALTAPARCPHPSRTITIYNEAGDVVTDPHERLRILEAEFVKLARAVIRHTGPVAPDISAASRLWRRLARR
ncbi:hypothetical protein [Bosea sp. LjRoot237]|uniref:hypothetical protein n=1 Tax=Bosea sp. LjRoot237 TaxID=3342292 RepID=UPI003ECE9448